ncbi:histidine-containing phosphotransfer protein 4-like isoform X2 [Juglans microcarpa x Juglans regia]|uniref:histidine-containing phosphotransfer protein 4-like isoform X2 n=1 Tax=Juglans microcarpa x Juglans regia TaxID=2249226 RepID=UPI001B7DBF81|nr:histidine-containing phosphotransfer protein 4-like isoform X2 [Juglans microcarpa x Juglans regia]
MVNNHMQRQLDMKRSLLDQGYLDEQFIQLEELEDDDNPNFVEEMVTTFYNNSARLLQNIEQALVSRPIDFTKLDNYMHRFKGSSSSIGATRVKKECTIFTEYCKKANAEGCIRTFLQVKQEHACLRRKLETYFQLGRQAAGPSANAGGQVG